MSKVDEDGENIWRQAEIANTINTMLQNKQSHIEFIKLFADLRYQKYKALIDAGFKEEQAMFIVIQTRVMD